MADAKHELMERALVVASRARVLGLLAALGTWLALALVVAAGAWAPGRPALGLASATTAALVLPFLGAFDVTRRRCDSVFHNLSRAMQPEVVENPDGADVARARQMLDHLLEHADLPILPGRAGIVAYGVALVCIIAGAIALIA